ncbi:hypothetical protein BRARA_A02185 [Brassica rapa]|uniref:Myb-like domain-containing protein n=1 Tax=Brassica campestris TaxID=3711 RepID=A0A398AP20_BRACM|nr:hypothetical protein BRARA_A02185 [Brassica rapa]
MSTAASMSSPYDIGHFQQKLFRSLWFSNEVEMLLKRRKIPDKRKLGVNLLRSAPTNDRNPRPCLHHRSSVAVLVISSSPSLIETTTDRNHHRSKPTTDRNAPARTTAIAIQTASPPYGLVIAGSRRIETHHRSNVFSCFVLRLLSSSPPEEGSKSTKDEDCVGPYSVSAVFSQSRQSLLSCFTSSPEEEPTTDDECLATHQSRDAVFSFLLRQKTDLFNFEITSEVIIFLFAFVCVDESFTNKAERKKEWTVSDDLVLISAWLNTSKDPLVGNEQKAGAFWQRIAEYYAASPKVERSEKIEPIQCKQKWQKINDLVCKFSGCYAVAIRQKTSGQSEADIVKMAHTIFANDHKTKFNLHHAWEELRHDQKWCEAATHKNTGSGKKRKCDGAQSDGATSPLCDQATQRPPGVKAAKAASGKRSIGDHQEGKGTANFETMCSIKERDMIVKERLSKQRLLESLISKKDPLSEAEKALKQKLINRVFEDV